jgi:hypothetical protein
LEYTPVLSASIAPEPFVGMVMVALPFMPFFAAFGFAVPTASGVMVVVEGAMAEVSPPPVPLLTLELDESTFAAAEVSAELTVVMDESFLSLLQLLIPAHIIMNAAPNNFALHEFVCDMLFVLVNDITLIFKYYARKEFGDQFEDCQTELAEVMLI